MLRIAMAVGGPLAGFALGWHETGKAEAGFFYALAGAGVVFLLFLVANTLAATPPALDAELRGAIAALEEKLASYAPVHEDDYILAGVGWILFRQWDKADAVRERDIEEYSGALEEIRRRASRPSLTVWGRRNSLAVHTKIPPEYWELETFDPTSLFVGNDDGIRTTKMSGVPNSRFSSLKINRAQFEREWPLS